MATTPKIDTIYIDIDDEITGIIDKVRSNDAKVIALVLPKRAAVLQSIVNMKLLKRSADESKKNLVLITSESGLLPLAGAVGFYVAKTLNSKPEIPSAPNFDDDHEEMINESTDSNLPIEANGMPIQGGSATEGLSGMTIPLDDEVETVELDDDLVAAGTPAAAAGAVDADTKKKTKKTKKDKKLKVPNFERFRLLLVLGVLVLILLIVGLVFAMKVLPKASINVQTDAANVNTNVSMTLSSTATTLDPTTNTVPSKQVTFQKTYTGTSPTTGQQNNGQVATGSATISLADCNKGTVTIPAGTGISSNGLTYITQQDVTLLSVGSGKNCNPKSAASFWSQTVNVSASAGGAKFNIPSGTAMTVASGQDYASTDVNAVSGDISGGTDNIEQVVAQADIDSASGKISTDDAAAKAALEQQLTQDNLYPLVVTYSAGAPTTTDSAAVGAVANSVTVTEVITYTMSGARQSDLETLIDNDINSQVNTAQQGILSDGFTNASFTTGTTANSLNMTTTAEVGPNISTATIKSDAVGKKSGDIIATIKGIPDVTNVTVHLSPFWVTTAPSNTSKITVNIAKPTSTAGNGG